MRFTLKREAVSNDVGTASTTDKQSYLKPIDQVLLLFISGGLLQLRIIAHHSDIDGP